MSYYLQKGSREIGPLEAENIVALLQAGDCLPTDLVRPEQDPEGWTPASTFFPEGSWTLQEADPVLIGSSNPLAVTIRQLLNQEQDEAVSHKLVSALANQLRRGERVQAVSVQKNLVINLAPEALVATTDRLLIVRDLIFGKNIESLAYQDIASISVKKELLGAVVRIDALDKRSWTIQSLPKESAEKIVRWVNARKEQVSVEPLEELKQGDPLARLKQLKELLDQGIITEADYAAKKSEILPLL
jgi:hypothetical protein